MELALDHVHDNSTVRAYDRGERYAQRIRYGDKAAVSEVTGKQKLLLRRAGSAEAYSAPLPGYCKI